MHVIAFLLALAAVALSLVYSGVYAEVAGLGADFAALKGYFGALDPRQFCVVASSALAVAGALFSLSKKRFGSLLLVAAAAVCLYGEFKLSLPYPHRAAAGLFALAAVVGWFRRKDVAPDGEDESDDAAAASADVSETPKASPAAKGSSRVNWWGLLFALVAAAYPLCMSGVGADAAARGFDPAWLKGFASFDAKTKLVLVASALSLLGGVIAFFRGTLGTTLLFAAAAVCGVTEFRPASLYPYAWVAFVLCLLAAVAAWPGRAADEERAARRYTGAYVFAFIFALAGAAYALCMSGAADALLSKGWPVQAAEVFSSLDCKSQAVCVIAAAGAVGAVLALFGVRLAAWPLLAAMLGSTAAELRWASFYNCSWVAILFFALSAMLAGAYVVADGEDPRPARKLTLCAALLIAALAAVAGGALTRYYYQSQIDAALREARANDPAYRQLDSELKERDAAIEQMKDSVREQAAFVAERDKKIADLAARSDAKDAEIANLTRKDTERDAQIAELNGQLEKLGSRLADAQAALNRKYVFVRGNTNVRNAPLSVKGSKVLGHLTDAVVEVLDTQRPAGSSAVWYQVKYGGGTAWVFGKNAVPINIDKK